ncbi:MAG: hypothetical protein P0Y56_04680 [Candidatus Andeanibacterium colombiense]|uniref:Heavy metal-binding domain-containing protein n=1 Tax=Candidatus Andeanibacterium colombiense TaxID=3121345 RepID=A0AAJ5X775_9SPHN|nr:MAG: hypothetical protein P0Y56_04680 [Sphingomonadaceae bacterium]
MNFKKALGALMISAVLLSVQPSVAMAKKQEANYKVVNEEFGLPVFPYDITDRPYEVLGEVKAGVRKATLFSKAPSQAKVYGELWERAEKLGADAVVKAQYGDPHVTALSWGSVSATGVAIRFTEPAAAPSS